MAGTATAPQRAEGDAPPRTAWLALLALGVVFGDIGTSPLYALRECFSGAHGVPPTRENVLGVLSLITWSLIIVISLKYLAFILRADNRGEGGILALLALVHPEHRPSRPASGRLRVPLLVLGLFGAALLYGDGMITPAISVLSAVEGLSVAAHGMERFVIPLTVAILVGIFMVQSRGTAKVGSVFGPVTFAWFLTLAALGLRGIALSPEVLVAVDPSHGVRFFARNGVAGFLVLGAVFLVVTGGEALYADMGHFGRRPIRVGWFFVVLPALLLNYLGQGGLLLARPEAVTSPFFLLAPPWAVYPLVGLAAAATIIASQAIITGAFSLSMQAVHLGYTPRLRIEHTSPTARGQIYMPQVNWILMIATLWLVLAFRSSSALAGAYGLAVTATMTITTILFLVLARQVWGWSWPLVAAAIVPLLLIDVAFFAANVPKIPAGGWFPLAVGGIGLTLLTTWRRGRKILGALLARSKVPLGVFLEQVRAGGAQRVRGTGVFPTGNPGMAPNALLRNLEHNKVLHEQVVVLSIVTEEVAYVRGDERLEFTPLGDGFYRIVARYGFMEQPDVPNLLALARDQGFAFDPSDTTYFLGREWLIPTKAPSGMAFWRERLFAFMTHNAQPATAYFRIPTERVVEVGAQIRI